MAIDYNAGINSIDVGAHDITYSGNEGPKSPEQKQMMAFDDTPRFELKPLRELISEYEADHNGESPRSIDALRRYFYNKYGPEGIAQVEQAVQREEQQAQMQQREGIQMASAADPMLQEEYDKYVFEMQEIGQEPMSLEQFRQQAVAGMATGGRVGFAWGGPGSGRDEKGYQSSHPSHSGGGGGGHPHPGVASQYSAPKSKPKTKTVSAPVGGGADMATVSAKQLGISKDTSVNRALVAAADEAQRKTELGNLIRQQQAEKKEELIEKFINKQIQKSNLPGILGTGVNILGSLFQKGSTSTRNFFLNNVLPSGKLGISLNDFYNLPEDEQEDFYQNYLQGRLSNETDAYGNPLSGGGEGNQGYMGYPSYEAWLAAQQAGGLPATAATTTPDPTIPGDRIRFAQNIDPDHQARLKEIYGGTLPTQFAADGGRIGYAGGGIADLRQGYFLGKIVKSLTKPFKGITKSLKKLTKSKAGKLAMLAMLGKGTGMFGSGGLKDLWLGKLGTAPVPGERSGGLWNWMKDNPFATITGASVLGGLTAEDDDDEGLPYDWEAKKAADEYWDPRFDESNFRRIYPADYADGGRTGYAEGGNDEDHRSDALTELYNPE